MLYSILHIPKRYGAENYEVTTRQTFVNGLVSGLTFGIYTPTTTTVKK
jgi:hypothetical protein